MGSTSEAAVQALVPYVGRGVADTCVRGTALIIGKDFETLAPDDLPALEKRVRHLLAPLLPTDAIDRVIAEIRGGVS